MPTIWHSRGIWPHDLGEFTFLARAMLAVGSARYPDQWDEQYITKRIVSRYFPSDVETNRDRMALYREARAVLRKNGIDSQRVRDAGMMIFRSGPLLDEEWAAGASFLDHHNEKIHLARTQLAEIQNEILGWLNTGQLQSALRSHHGGDFTPLNSFWWNSENIRHLFDKCKAEPSKPHSQVIDISSSEFSWIFVNKSDLSRLISSQSEGRPVDEIESSERYISDLLAFTLRLSVELKDDLKDPGYTKESLEDFIKMRWPKLHQGRDPRPITVTSIATVLRNEEAQKGTGSELRMRRAAK